MVLDLDCRSLEISSILIHLYPYKWMLLVRISTYKYIKLSKYFKDNNQIVSAIPFKLSKVVPPKDYDDH